MRRIFLFVVFAFIISSMHSEIFASDPEDAAHTTATVEKKPNYDAKQEKPVAGNSADISEEECRRYRDERQALRDPTLNPNQAVRVNPMSDREQWCLEQERARTEEQNRKNDLSRRCYEIRMSLVNEINHQAEQDQCIDRLRTLAGQRYDLIREHAIRNEEYNNTFFLTRWFGGNHEYAKIFSDLQRRQFLVQQQIEALECNESSPTFINAICKRYAQYTLQCPDAVDYILPDQIRNACTK